MNVYVVTFILDKGVFMVYYEGLTKEEVLCALYNNAKCKGYGFLHYNPEDMTIEQAGELLKTTLDFDYLYGRVMKVNLSGDEGFEEWLYDRDNGKGAAQSALDDYRATKTNNL